MLKALDKDNYYAEKLNLQKNLEEEVEVTENIRCLLTRHNKNIRLFTKWCEINSINMITVWLWSQYYYNDSSI